MCDKTEDYNALESQDEESYNTQTAIKKTPKTHISFSACSRQKVIFYLENFQNAGSSKTARVTLFDIWQSSDVGGFLICYF